MKNLKESNPDFNVQLESHSALLKNFALKLTQDINDANDLVQETFLKAMMYSSKFKEGTNLKGWLMTIMRNTFINGYRRNTKRKTFMDTQEEQYIIDSAQTFNTYNDGESKFIRRDLSNAISKLPHDLKEAFELNAKGFKYHEIAEKVNVPLGTVKTRIFIARRRLRVSLSEYEKAFDLQAS